MAKLPDVPNPSWSWEQEGALPQAWCWQKDTAPLLWLPQGKGLGAVALWWFLLLLLEGMVAPLQGASFHTVRG